MNFESELKKGSFVVGRCTKCNNGSWPPSDFCTKCFGSLQYSPIKQPGILIEWSSKEDKIFGIVEFENTIRVIGTITNHIDLKPGQKMKITSCGFDGSPKFTFSPDLS